MEDVFITCETCLKTVKVAHNRQSARFCSHPCYARWRTTIKLDEEHKKKISLGGIGKHRESPSLEARKKMSIAKLGRKLTKEHIRNSLRRRPMSTLEIKFNEIVNKHNLPYKFVGNGKFFIERKNPDFINVDGKNIAVEVYVRKHKKLFKGDVDGWKQERQEIFSRHGWKILFFDETQVNEQHLLTILRGKAGAIKY